MKYDYVKRAYIVEQITAAEMQSALKQMTGSEVYFKVLEIINAAPAEKVAPVVFCAECEFNNTEKKCLYPDSIIKIPGDHDFCSYGKPRTTQKNVHSVVRGHWERVHEEGVGWVDRCSQCKCVSKEAGKRCSYCGAIMEDK